jgi:serine/threonine-protein phosphatase 5
MATAAELKDKGNEAFKTQHYTESIDYYTKAIEADPTVPAFYTNRAFAYIRTEGYGAAIQDANEAIRLDKNFAKAYYRRASANMALFKFKESLRDYELVLTISPRDADAMKKKKECEKIIQRKAFEKAIAVESKSAIPLRTRVTDIEAALAVEEAYKGPRLGEQITVEFVTELVAWFRAQKLLHRKYAMQIMLWTHDLLMALPNIAPITIPSGLEVTVCGDVHGQFYDLLNIFEINGMPSETNPYLFNGDYIDRGSFSVEVILTMFSLRLLYPNHFFLSRGNHETINMNKMYGFDGEVKSKFNDILSDYFNDIFNHLPLGHIINNKILVVHGGLPEKDDVTIADIQAVNRVRQPPDEGIMCDLLWCDPQMMPGRAASKRGVGCQFGPDVTAHFLAKNDLSLLVRSHEMKENGYEVQHDGKCITVFSAPNYCDQMGNKGAFIRFAEDLQPKFTTFEAVPHPDIKPMQYAGAFNSFFS